MRETLLGRRGRFALLGLGMVGGALLVLVVYAILSSAVNSSETNERGESREKQTAVNDQTLRIIRDCTEPSGECFKRGQKATAEAVSQIGAGNILAVVCALNVPNGTPLEDALDQVTTCVADRLNKT